MRPLVVVFLLPWLMCCHISRHSRQAVVEQEGTPISFLVFSINKNTAAEQTTVKLISRKESSGTVKKQHDAPLINALTVYTFSGKQCVDSATVEHPLYKHLEYMDDHGQFAVKDTVFSNADFFVRLKGNFNTLKIFEKLKGQQPKQLETINL